VTGRRLAVVVAGCLGAELVGAMGFALAAGLLAIDLAGPAIVGVFLAPVLAAAGGPLGYDLATSWARDDEKALRAEPGSRAGVHAAGVATALLILAVCVLAGAAAPFWPTVYLVMIGLCALPVLGVAGRRFALRFTESPTLLPVSLVVVVAGALGVFGSYLVFIARMFSVFGED
jgi:hypothetical protein